MEKIWPGDDWFVFKSTHQMTSIVIMITLFTSNRHVTSVMVYDWSVFKSTPHVTSIMIFDWLVFKSAHHVASIMIYDWFVFKSTHQMTSVMIYDCSGTYLDLKRISLLKIWPGDHDLWPWKSIRFQILLRTKYVPSLVKIHGRMLILVFTRMYLYHVKIYV
jgi:hypothetical protein